MKRLSFFISVLVLLFGISFLSTASAQDSTQTQAQKQFQHKYQKNTTNQFKGQMRSSKGHGFVDLNGDGYNDNAPDADGDGIPNGMDPDYTGAKMRAGKGARGFVDLDGDGINDNALDADGDGIPNGQDPDYVRPMNGSGAKRAYGKGRGTGAGSQIGAGTGICDGTGPKGAAKRQGQNRK